MSENSPEYAQPDADDVPFNSVPVQDNDEAYAQPDAEYDAHPDTLAGDEADGDIEVDPTDWDDEPNGDEPTGADQ